MAALGTFVNPPDNRISNSLWEVWNDAGPTTGQGPRGSAAASLGESPGPRVVYLRVHVFEFAFPLSVHLCWTETAVDSLWGRSLIRNIVND